METFYHGSSKKFSEFDLSHALEGDGKVKFGFGVYVTGNYDTAKHYAASGIGKNADMLYVYTVEVPDMTEDNHLWSNRPVCDAIVARTEAAIGEAIPEIAKTQGKMFRKYLANFITDNKGTIKQMTSKASLEVEKEVSKFLLSIGVEMLVWPYAQTKPDGLQNRAILDDKSVIIKQIDIIENGN